MVEGSVALEPGEARQAVAEWNGTDSDGHDVLGARVDLVTINQSASFIPLAGLRRHGWKAYSFNHALHVCWWVTERVWACALLEESVLQGVGVLNNDGRSGFPVVSPVAMVKACSGNLVRELEVRRTVR